MGLKRFLKKTRKALGIPAITLGNVAKVGAAAATGGLGAGALALGSGVLKSKLKSAAVGGIKQIIRTKSQRAQLKRIETLGPPKIVGISSAVTMPGGAPLKGERKKASLPLLGQQLRKRRAVRKAAKKAPTERAAGKRKPPKGGKDLKALSASWRAAGKPGKWLDWVKTH